MFVYLQGYPEWKKNGYPTESMTDIVMNVKIPLMSAAELKERLDKGEAITIVDLRDREDRGQGTIKGALWLPLENLMAQYDKIPKTNPICLFCVRGKQGPIAGQYLVKQGYTKVFVLENGITDGWMAAGYPLEKL